MLLYKQVRNLFFLLLLLNCYLPAVAQIWNIGDSIPAVMPSGLLYHFDFANSIIEDKSGNQVATQLIGSRWVEGRHGDANGAILFSENVDVLLTQAIPLPEEYSIMVWFKPLPMEGNVTATLIKTRAIEHSGGDHPLLYIRPTGDLGIYTYDSEVGKKKNFSFTASINDAELKWNQLVITATNTDSTYCYINGDLAGALPFKAIGNALSIGNNVFEFNPSQGYNQPFGTIDEIALWNKKLNQEQIRRLYAGTFTASFSKTNACKNEELKAYITPSQPNVSYQVWDKDRNVHVSNAHASDQGLLSIPFQLEQSARIGILARDITSGMSEFLSYDTHINVVPQENKQLIPEDIYEASDSAVVFLDSTRCLLCEFFFCEQ